MTMAEQVFHIATPALAGGLSSAAVVTLIWRALV